MVETGMAQLSINIYIFLQLNIANTRIPFTLQWVLGVWRVLSTLPSLEERPLHPSHL